MADNFVKQNGVWVPRQPNTGSKGHIVPSYALTTHEAANLLGISTHDIEAMRGYTNNAALDDLETEGNW